MNSFEINQLVITVILMFNITVLIIEDGNQNMILKCSEGDTYEAFVCIFSNMYTWMLIVNVISIIYIIYWIIRWILSCCCNPRERYIPQVDVPPV